jgi:1,4-dihydroxy-2-naphthoate octaprenyltransferase
MSFLQVTLGTAIAADDGFFNLPFYALTIVGVGLAQNAVNVLNDYYDCRTGVDARTMKTPFSGVVSSLIKPEAAFTFGITSLLMAASVGVYLIWTRGQAVIKKRPNRSIFDHRSLSCILLRTVCHTNATRWLCRTE